MNQLSDDARVKNSNESTLAEIFAVPPEITEAARKVEKWFKENGYSHWKFCGLESRDYPQEGSLPRPYPPITWAEFKDSTYATIPDRFDDGAKEQ